MPISKRRQTALPLRAGLFANDAGFLMRASKRVHDAERDASGRQPLTSPQFAILLAATRVPGSDQATISRLSALDTSTTSETIRRLSQKRQLTLHQDPSDARRSLVFASDSAKPIVEAYLHQLEDADQRVISWVPPEDRAKVLSLLRAIAYQGPELPAPGSEVMYAISETNFAFGRLIRIAGQRFDAIWREQESDLSSLGHDLLRVLKSFPGISQNLAGRVLFLDRATVAALVARLEDRRLIASQVSQTDRRRKELSLTAEGAEETQRIDAVRARVDDHFLTGVEAGDRTFLLRNLFDVTIAATEIGHADF